MPVIAKRESAKSGVDEALPVRVVQDDRLAAIASVHHMADRAWVLNSEFACHGQALSAANEERKPQFHNSWDWSLSPPMSKDARSRRGNEADQVHGAGPRPLPHVSGYVRWSRNARGGLPERVTPTGAWHRQEPTTPIRAGAAGPSVGSGQQMTNCTLCLFPFDSATILYGRSATKLSRHGSNCALRRSAASRIRGFGVPIPRVQHSPCELSAVGSLAI